jgi:hypothetical protein
MSASEHAAIKEIYFLPFNEPVTDGSHLLKTWEYLKGMGAGENLGLWQRELLDHVRAWKGRNLIYGAVWGEDAEKIYANIKCRILLMCARDNILRMYFGFVIGLRPEAKKVEIEGKNWAW